MGWGVPYLLPWALNDTRKSPFQGKEQKKAAMGRSVPKRWAQVDFSGLPVGHGVAAGAWTSEWYL